jgi:hypothetical protein
MLAQAFWFDPTTNALEYVSLVGPDGATYILDFSKPGIMGIVDENGNTVYIDSEGIHLSSPDCSIAVDIAIDNFAQQLNSQNPPSNSSSTRRRRSLEKRFKDTIFAVAVNLQDQCEVPVTDLTPSLNVGPTPCSLLSSGSGLFTWNCHFPGDNSDEMRCENAINFWLVNGAAGGIAGSSTNWGTVGKSAGTLLGGLARTGAIGKAIVAAGALASIPAVAGVLGVAATAITVLAWVEVGLAVWNTFGDFAQSVCMLKYSNQFPLPLQLSAGSTNAQLAALNTAPANTITTQLSINDPNDQTCSACNNPGTCGSYSSCVSNPGCYCGINAEGKNFCFTDNLCSAMVGCSSSASCGAGQACLVQSCCGGGVCINSCSSGSNIKRRDFGLWARGDLNGTSGLTALGYKVL